MLCNVVRKPIEVIFREFLGTARDQAAGGAAWSASGDVKYTWARRTTGRTPTAARCGSSCSRTVALEAVNPLVVGKARARAWTPRATRAATPCCP